MIAIDALEEMSPDSSFLLNVHDSYGMSMVPEDVEPVMREVKHRIEDNRGLRIPLILEVSHAGKNWWDSISKGRMM